MPEGPEVSILTNSLNKLLKNKTLIKVKVLKGGKYENKPPKNYITFTKTLPLKVNRIRNKGKLMYWEFSNDTIMINHLNMTGIWTIGKKLKHSALEFRFKRSDSSLNDDEDDLILYYIDIRRFGRVEFTDNKLFLNDIGPDIVNDKSFSFKDFLKIAKTKKRINITKFLMDQKNISGIGNYIKSEVLYEAKISPHRNIEDLSDEELKRIYLATKKITKLSLDWGGMSMSDFRDIDGKKGDFQKILKVYRLSKDINGKEIKKEKTKDGRTTFWVPEIQF
jgi:formamidopyrimidine-DNA glycosylase